MTIHTNIRNNIHMQSPSLAIILYEASAYRGRGIRRSWHADHIELSWVLLSTDGDWMGHVGRFCCLVMI